MFNNNIGRNPIATNNDTARTNKQVSEALEDMLPVFITGKIIVANM